MRNIILYLVLILFLTGASKQKVAAIHQTDLWQAGKGSYNSYRIPSVIVTQKGTILAFCEGREGGDAGDIDLLLKRSSDYGETWSEEQIVWNDGENTCGNPCPIVDEDTGRIWLFMTWNLGSDHESKIINKTSMHPRRPYLCYSDDDGLNWSEPKNLSETCRDDDWGWYATGPGIGIQIKQGKYKGRLVIPANHSYTQVEGDKISFVYGAQVLYSDDHGKNWSKSESIKPGCNESQVVELTDGRLLMNMRSYNNQSSRAISFSEDGGDTWSEISHDYQLVESKCQASILNFGEYEGENMHLFLNPAVPKGRNHLTLKASFDNCETWVIQKLIFKGPSAYSCITKLPNGRIGIFYENGKISPYKRMTFVSMDVNEIVNP